jgi:hypothetical protein
MDNFWFGLADEPEPKETILYFGSDVMCVDGSPDAYARRMASGGFQHQADQLEDVCRHSKMSVEAQRYL